MDTSVREAIRAVIRGRALFDSPVAPFTTYRIGGPAEAILFPAGLEDLKAVARILAESGGAVRTIGKGSKLLVRDGGFRGALVSLCDGFTAIGTRDEGWEIVRVRAEAGVFLPTLADWAARQGLSGIEWAQGVPGTVGGAVRMNAGAFGGRTSDIVTEIELLDWASGEISTIGRADLRARFRYRALEIDPRLAILAATLDLQRDDPGEIAARMHANREKRKGGQPLDLPSAGSVFKNPPGMVAKAARLIEEAGMKGRRRGNAAVSEKHGNFIVNLGGAKASDVLGLIEDVRSAVKEKHGVELELELQVLGEDEA